MMTDFMHKCDFFFFLLYFCFENITFTDPKLISASMYCYIALYCSVNPGGVLNS